MKKFVTGKGSRKRYRKILVLELIYVLKIFEFRRLIMGTSTGSGGIGKFGTGKNSWKKSIGIILDTVTH